MADKAGRTMRGARDIPPTSSVAMIVAVASVAFGGLIVYLAELLYPLVGLLVLYGILRTDFSVSGLTGAWIVRSKHRVQIHLQSLWRQLYGANCENSSAPPPDAAVERLKTNGITLSSTKTRDSDNQTEHESLTVKFDDELSISTASNIGQKKDRMKRQQRSVIDPSNTPTLRITDLGIDASGSPITRDTGNNHANSEIMIVEPNSEMPYEFENEFVQGKLLFLLKGMDGGGAYAHLFSGKRRLFWVQMQVRFKKSPAGILYIGGEVPRPMNLGFFTGGFAKIILGVLQSLVRGLHYGFGLMYPDNVATQEDEELPHICFPLYTAVDQFVCTPQGQEPPTLGVLDFGEPQMDSLTRRKSGDAFYAYNTMDTYSFHFHSYFIDFTTWKLQNVPGMKNIGLSSFWDDMPLRIVAYSLKDGARAEGNSTRNSGERDTKKIFHSLSSKKYMFCFELSHKLQHQLDIYGVADSYGENEDSSCSIHDEATISQLKALNTELRRYEFSIPVWFEYLCSTNFRHERRVGYVLVVREFDCPIGDEAEDAGGDSKGSKRVLKAEYMVLHTAFVVFAPLVVIQHELGKRRRSSSSTKRFPFNHRTKPLEECISIRSEWDKSIKIEEERRFVEQELRRLSSYSANNLPCSIHARQLITAQSALLELLQIKATSLRGEWKFLSPSFRSRSSSDCLGNSSFHYNEDTRQDCSAVTNTDPHASSQVVRTITATHWRNEWITMDKYHRVLRFFRMMKSSPLFTISMANVLQVEKGFGDADVSERGRFSECEDDRYPHSELFWLQLVALEKCHHVAFSTREERDRWLVAIRRSIHAALKDNQVPVLAQPILNVSQHVTMDAFSSGTSRKRFILNDRCNSFLHTRCSSLLSSHMEQQSQQSPNQLVAKYLHRVLHIQSICLEANSIKELFGFMEDVETLKWLCIRSLQYNEDERKVFFLNLYHLMLLHARVLGFLPRSKTQWSKFFNGICYNIGGIVFSLAEIEHCIIRAPMASLRHVIAKLVIPKWQPSDERQLYRLTHKDVRLNFALNCLTKSCWDAVMIYDTDSINAQLDRAVQETVGLSVSYDRESRIVYLPKNCDWYREDFSELSPPSKGPSPAATLCWVMKYLRGQKRQLLEYVWERQETLITKYKYTKYDYHFHESVHKASLERDGDGDKSSS